MQSSRAAADELLLDIYSSMNEPDGIYAVARGHSMVSQLKLYEHESSWDKALTGYDLLCRRAPPASTPLAPPLAQPGPGTAVSGGSSSHWQQGLLTALQQLGCRHLIEAYWQGQPASLSTGELLLASLRPLCPPVMRPIFLCRLPLNLNSAQLFSWRSESSVEANLSVQGIF